MVSNIKLMDLAAKKQHGYESPKGRILVVEDEFLVAHQISLLLDDLGYLVVDTVAEGCEAVEAAARELPDLVLMDIGLRGEMDGVEAASIIKRELNLPVVYLTAYHNRDIIDRAKASQPLGYLVKPLQPELLDITVSSAMKRERERKDREDRIRELKGLVEISKNMKGMLAICSGCKKIRDEEGDWQSVERFMQRHLPVSFSHSICPDCVKALYPDLYPDLFPET